jgi:hypothetical protein
MKNALLALTLVAFVGTASAHEGKHGKKDKKETCTKGTAGSSCCMKKSTKTAAVTPKPAAVKSL